MESGKCACKNKIRIQTLHDCEFLVTYPNKQTTEGNLPELSDLKDYANRLNLCFCVDCGKIDTCLEQLKYDIDEIFQNETLDNMSEEEEFDY